MYWIRLLVGSQWRSKSKGVMCADLGHLQMGRAEQSITDCVNFITENPRRGSKKSGTTIIKPRESRGGGFKRKILSD